MKIKILKDDPSGLKKGQVKDIPDHIAKQVIKNGIAQEVKVKTSKK